MQEIEDFQTLSLLRQFARYLSNSGKDERALDMAEVMLMAAARIDYLRVENASLLRRYAKAELESSANHGRAIAAERKLEKVQEWM
jgi:hypothetical protein